MDLTGLFNERYLQSAFCDQKEQQKLPFVLYYLDLDHFKPVNDTYGHDTGRQTPEGGGEDAFRNVAAITIYAFRIGGDEFALIISANMTEPSLRGGQKTASSRSLACHPMIIDHKTLN